MKATSFLKKAAASFVSATLLIVAPGLPCYQAAAQTVPLSSLRSLDAAPTVDAVPAAPLGGLSAVAGDASAVPALSGSESLSPLGVERPLSAAREAAQALPSKDAAARSLTSAASANVSRPAASAASRIGRALSFGYFDNARSRGELVSASEGVSALSRPVASASAPIRKLFAIAAGVGTVLAAAPAYASDSASQAASLFSAGNIALGVAGVVGLVVALVVLRKTFVVVKGTQLAQVERRWFGKNMPEGRVVAMANELGIQARILGPGLHILFPFLYKVDKFEMKTIAEDEVGLVEAIDGQPVPPGSIFAKTVQGHNFFQDGEAFIKNGGQKGPQLQILPPGTYRINPYLFKVTNVPVETIKDDEIGIVMAQDGKPMEAGRLLAHRVDGHNNFQDGDAFLNNGGQKGPQMDILLPGTYRLNSKLFQVVKKPATKIETGEVGQVTAKDGEPLPQNEYVGKAVEGHRNFQDASAFLANGGQRGPQLEILTPGTYRINPYMFEVKPDKVAVVERGNVAVIVSNVGKDPSKDAKPGEGATDDRLKDGTEKYVVEPGYRGIQKEVSGPGTYNVNRMAVTPQLVPTTNITIDWADEEPEKAEKTEKTEKSARIFDPLEIVSKDGFAMTISVKVIIRVLPEQAPHMVARIGSIENLIKNVVHPLIDSSFRNQASSVEAMRFMEDRHEMQGKAEDHVRQELAKYHVECVSVLICDIKLPEKLMETRTNSVLANQQIAMYKAQQAAAEQEKETRNVQAQAAQQPDLVKAKIGVQIAEQDKQKAITLAEGKREQTRLEQEGAALGVEAMGKADATRIKAIGEAEGAKIAAVGQATADAYKKQADALGQQGLSLIEVFKLIAEGKMKMVPDVLVQGGNGDAGSGLMQALVANLVANGILKPAPVTPPAPPAATEAKPAEKK